MCCVAIAFKVTDYSNGSASKFALSLNIPPWKLIRWFGRPQLWATSDWQLHHDNVPTHASHLVQSFLAKTSNHPGDQPPYSTDLVPCDFWLFPKLKSPLKGKRFQIISEIQENTTRQLMMIGKTMWGPKVPTLKETEASLSCVQRLLYLVSSINVSTSHSKWMNTFWTDCIYVSSVYIWIEWFGPSSWISFFFFCFASLVFFYWNLVIMDFALLGIGYFTFL